MNQSLKIIGIFFTIFSLNFQTTFAQTISAEDLDYLYVSGNNDYNKSIYDIRGNKKLFENIGNGTIKYSSSKKRIVISDWKSLKVFDTNGGKIADAFVGRNEYLAPNWKYKLFIKDNDIWRSEFNWSNGKFEGEKRLTELGIFGGYRGLKILHWYEDYIFLQFYVNNTYKNVVVNAGNATLEEPPFVYPATLGDPTKIGIRTSPSGRYLAITSNMEEDYIYDLKEQKKYKLVDHPQNNAAANGCWLDDTRFCLLEVGQDYVKFFDKVIPNLESNYSITTKREPIFYHWSYWEHHVQYFSNLIKYLKASYDGSYIIGVNPYEGSGHMMLLDTKNNQIIETGVIRKPDLLMEWIDEKNFVYVDKSDIIKQGTYLYDAESQSKTKITSFLANSVLVLDKADKLIFRANNKTFSGSIKSKEFKETNEFGSQAFFGRLYYSIED